jgi:alkanesulfonate monooxygenase
MRLGVDASKFDLDAPLPPLPPSNQSQSSQATLVALAREQNYTVRDLARLVGGYGGLTMLGTPAEIADQMQEWLETGASDGFNVMFHTMPEGLNDFVDTVIPELTRRGIFREAYAGTTLREHLGLERPKNRFFEG